ncbi:Biopolymer transport protein ExbD/TolR [Lacunisphaera limnophila]|uniref:Biopolymer transport protein ExbD/TolR n=1 Tax=Lacunisphaera limnophila TaxID=1838286 RepID=A0A1D8ARE1_9BACT|nr:biopolymer transporter ExbD [Lacunisphaera limnophila]AOS43447.1 Biopolymer transport protein ExbD/TolR [Lacunisphaera limnophila]
MITQPLELQSRLSPAPRDLDFFAWVNVGLIALFFGLLGSRFVLAPGLAVGLGNEGTLALPQISGAEAGAGPASVVVSYRRDKVILFEGGMYDLKELRTHMAAYAEKHPGAVMLVRSDAQVSMQAILDLCEMARAVGFANVLLAAEQTPVTAPR